MTSEDALLVQVFAWLAILKAAEERRMAREELKAASQQAMFGLVLAKSAGK